MKKCKHDWWYTEYHEYRVCSYCGRSEIRKWNVVFEGDKKRSNNHKV